MILKLTMALSIGLSVICVSISEGSYKYKRYARQIVAI